MPTLKPLVFAALLALAGCATPNVVARPGTGIPPTAVPGVVHEEGLFDGTGGLKLFEQSWHPQGSAKGALIMVHGLKDHSSRYGDAAEQLAHRGYAVYAFDLRGHGRSEGVRAYTERFDDYLNDLQLFVARVQQREPGKPLFLFGHSMGGAIATLFTLTRKPELRGLILSGPALKPGSDVSGFLIATTKMLSGIAPHAAVLELDNKSFSRDSNVVAAMESDPFVYNKPMPARTAGELLGALDRIEHSMEALETPVLVMHGTLDRLTNPEGSKELVERASTDDKTLRLYEGVYHDLLHEPERVRILSEMTQWMDKRVGG